jgi:DNA-binding NtrC family response regulator
MLSQVSFGSNGNRALDSPAVIKIMQDAFEQEQVQQLVHCLEADGHRCDVFKGSQRIRAAFSDARTKLLVLRATEDNIHPLVEVIRSCRDKEYDVPILASLSEATHVKHKEQILRDVDDFLVEPLSLQEVCMRIRRLTCRHTEKSNDAGRLKDLIPDLGLQKFIGTAPSFVATIRKIPRVAACQATVLLSGDTGTGKEMCARSIHSMSRRANKPFVALNCGSIPNELFENEMFGHEPEAFTDANKSKRGLIAEAEGGTLFLDEVDTLSLTAQVKLLRFLQDKQYKPLGSTRNREADVRLIAASNRNLKLRVQEGAFRHDLYYRLNIVCMSLPPLRDRHEDILPLATYFLKMAAREFNLPETSLSRNARQKLQAYDWPGNVRELENVIQQAVVMAEGPVIRAHDLQLSFDEPAQDTRHQLPLKAAKARVIESFERDYLCKVIAACEGNISKAAREAKKNRRAFYALLKKYGLTTPGLREDSRL